MTEPTYNLFLYCDESLIITELGVVCHELAGSDREMGVYLLTRVADDMPIARRFPVPDRYGVVPVPVGEVTRLPPRRRAGVLPLSVYNQLFDAGRHLEVFEEVLESLAAPETPFTCVTPVVNGQIGVDLTVLTTPAAPTVASHPVAGSEKGDLKRWLAPDGPPGHELLVVDLGLDATNEQLLEKMWEMRSTRLRNPDVNVVCSFRGFGADPRELREIPEVRAFCRRLTAQGFISYLDACTTLTPATDPALDRPFRQWWGAFEVWSCGEGHMNRTRVTAEVMERFRKALEAANARADAACGSLE
jgi:hypothetical protein